MEENHRSRRTQFCAMGHIDLVNDNFISYAYQDENGSWGMWNTFLNPITIEQKGRIHR
jgi:hypothetical protein